MLLVTSVPPMLSRKDSDTDADIGREYLGSCVESWKRNGFDPVSVNRFDGVEAVEEMNLIDCIGGSNTEVYFSTRFGPCLGAIFDVLPQDRPALITNADIYVITNDGCADFLSNQAQSSVVAARCLNVKRHGAPHEKVFVWGYDRVAFTPSMIPKSTANGLLRRFQLCLPWWDYVFPYSFSEEVPAFRVEDPVFSHLSHPDRWSDSVWHDCAKFARDACPSIENEAITSSVSLAREGPTIAQKYIREIFGNRLVKLDPLLLKEIPYRVVFLW